MKFKYYRLRGGSSSDSVGSSSPTTSDEDEDTTSFSGSSQENSCQRLSTFPRGTTWCQLAYWEECNRVGRLFPVSASTFEVFSALPKGDGLCLASLFKQNKKPSESTTRTREKIGQGILLNHSLDGGVWVYNRTENAIFVNSPTLEPPWTPRGSPRSNNPYTVVKVLPGYSIQIFDYAKSTLYERLRGRRGCESQVSLDCGPFDPHSIRISFVKGWGTNYSRQVVTNCPCWLEVLLNVPPPESQT